MPSSKTRIAIIGGGVAGLVVARHVTSKPENYNVTLFEQTDQVGGTWVYTDDTEFDRNGLSVHSSMYKNLRTNLPKEIMQIQDFPFQEKCDASFVHHSAIRQYLLEYAKHFNLFHHTKLNTLVKHVTPESLADGQTIWTITYMDVISKIVSVKTFDVVVLCNGHYTVGNIPPINGSETFPGDCIHSHQYRYPEKYAGKKVCVLGASWSGIDITLEICKHAEKVYLSHNLPEPLDAHMANNVEQKPGISSISGNTFIFQDGTSADVDDFIYCTGYQFTYPFLSEKVKIKTDENNVEPIYKHLVHCDYPSLFFMGIPGIVIPFPMFHIQAQYILRLLEGRAAVLPSSIEMHEHVQREKKALMDQGIPARHINKMKERQWAYYDEIAKLANVPSFPPVVKKIYDHTNAMRLINFTTYKNYRYRIVDAENFTVSYCKPC
ncbi:flavin-containing monooxygenase FMO GS-OX-like 4 [Venturia canescens]|uniref:flavin-containing monooxygenase FMO GS-OX-like 4 n=1 Tax=Venturia canescens TaxID=32260 RepID=UPI001C9C176D|nr:flavin-containing monooxygenase FMO GS-OX-like 4 [Venturia canescens]